MKVILVQDNYGFSGMMYSGIRVWDNKNNISEYFAFDKAIRNKEEAYQQAIINFFTKKQIKN